MVRRRQLSLPAGYPARDAGTYAAFRAALAASGCALCPLHASRTRIVVDRGTPGARLMLIGEGPGAEEDAKGLAFVGRSGRLLDEMLTEAGIHPASEILIANVVKCRPPGNRPPTDSEAEKCLPFLRRQIELTAPRFLALLGATAANHLLPGDGKKRLSSRVGKFFQSPDFPGIDLMILFHPAYILRNPRRRDDMVEHLSLLRERMTAVVREEIALN